MMEASGAVWMLSAVVVMSAWLYFRTWAMTRPPLGTVNLGDVVLTLVCIVILPFLYLWLPGWLVGSLLAIMTLSILWFVVEPVTTVLVARWSVAGGFVAADLLLIRLDGSSGTFFLLANDVVMLMIAVGVSNLWVQGGLRARDLAILAGAIAVYDLIATGFLPVTTAMIERLSGMPFLPMVVWPAGAEQWIGIGLGDLLMASVGPLVMRKAFGRTAGIAAMAIALGAIGGVLLVARWDALPETFPTMIVLGPLMVLHYRLWSWRSAGERTIARYLADEPRSSRVSGTATTEQPLTGIRQRPTA